MSSDALALIHSFGVSRETINKLKIYEGLLRKWQPKMNLVSSSTLDDLWLRHFVDSLQLLPLAGKAINWVDLGSGAGFPGMPIGIHLADKRAGVVHLVEADHRKCAFLREVARTVDAAVVVHHGKIEDLALRLPNIDIVTARAVAPLSRLIDFASPLLKKGSLGLFLKGQDIVTELTESPIDSIFDVSLVDSQSSADGKIVTIRCASG